MSLTLKILLAADAFFALLLIVYLAVKYGKLFSKRTELFTPEIKNGVEVEVAYVDEPLTVKTEEVASPTAKEVKVEEVKEEEPAKEEVVAPCLSVAEIEPKEEEEKPKEEVALTIGSFEELETLVSSEKE